jgi:hypothetical protein
MRWVSTGWVGRVDENYGFAAIRLLPDGTKVFMR